MNTDDDGAGCPLLSGHGSRDPRGRRFWAETEPPSRVECARRARATLEIVQADEGRVDKRRLDDVEDEIKQTGSYWQTFDELCSTARLAWRNNPRCIGRLHWRSLTVLDRRHLTDPVDIFGACVDHIQLATNGGKIRPMMTVFAPQQPSEPGIRIWNEQLIGYAGYSRSRGVGDLAHVAITESCRALGWSPPEESAWDILPLVIDAPNVGPRLFVLPQGTVVELPIEHPERPEIGRLGLKWYAVPVISNMLFDGGGVHYPAAPFNGWYMETEIAARDLADSHRYNLLPLIASVLGLNMSSPQTLWQDRAAVELNVAVLASFRKHGTTIVDHHTASRQFVHHLGREAECGRTVDGDWTWLVPPLAPATSPLFHRYYRDAMHRPGFFYQEPPPNQEAWRDMQGTEFHRESSAVVP